MKLKTIFALTFIFAAALVQAQQIEDSLVSVLKKTAAYTNLALAEKDSDAVVKLVLRGNKLTQFPKEILAFKNLEYLDLSNNKLTTIPAEIAQLTNLKVLILEGNKLADLPVELYALYNLRVLNVGRNQLYYMSAKIGNLTELIQLDVWSNNIAEFPEEISKLNNLKVVDMRSIAMNDEQQADIMKLLPNAKVLLDASCHCN
jgi:Leucine-rich repeat (LRR) protein